MPVNLSFFFNCSLIVILKYVRNKSLQTHKRSFYYNKSILNDNKHLQIEIINHYAHILTKRALYFIIIVYTYVFPPTFLGCTNRICIVLKNNTRYNMLVLHIFISLIKMLF